MGDTTRGRGRILAVPHTCGGSCRISGSCGLRSPRPPFRTGGFTMIKYIHRIATVGAISAGLALAAALPAGASISPAFTSHEQAAYAVTNARFRFVETTFTLPNATTVASELPGGLLSVSVQLVSSENTWMVLRFSSTTASVAYSA